MKNRVVICLIILSWAFGANYGLAQTNINWDEVIASQRKTISELPDKIEHQLSILKTNKSDESVRQLFQLVNSLRNVDLGDRSKQTGIWLDVLGEIDLNSTEISGHVLWKTTPPPDGTNGIQYPPGIAPSVLTNLAARSNYEAAIFSNDQRMRNEAFKCKLRQLDEQASPSFERYVKSFYTSSENDKKELKELLETSNVSDVRKHKISNIVGLSMENNPTKK